MITKKFGIEKLILAMLLVSVVMPVASADVESNLNVDTSENSVGYTATELQDLYYRYNISENDIKFAKNELPNFLEGTILRSDKRVIVTEDGNTPKNMKQEVNFDVIISEQEMKNIIEEARKNILKNMTLIQIVHEWIL